MRRARLGGYCLLTHDPRGLHFAPHCGRCDPLEAPGMPAPAVNTANYSTTSASGLIPRKATGAGVVRAPTRPRRRLCGKQAQIPRQATLAVAFPKPHRRAPRTCGVFAYRGGQSRWNPRTSNRQRNSLTICQTRPHPMSRARRPHLIPGLGSRRRRRRPRAPGRHRHRRSTSRRTPTSHRHRRHSWERSLETRPLGRAPRRHRRRAICRRRLPA